MGKNRQNFWWKIWVENCEKKFERKISGENLREKILGGLKNLENFRKKVGGILEEKFGDSPAPPGRVKFFKISAESFVLKFRWQISGKNFSDFFWRFFLKNFGRKFLLDFLGKNCVEICEKSWSGLELGDLDFSELDESSGLSQKTRRCCVAARFRCGGFVDDHGGRAGGARLRSVSGMSGARRRFWDFWRGSARRKTRGWSRPRWSMKTRKSTRR